MTEHEQAIRYLANAVTEALAAAVHAAKALGQPDGVAACDRALAEVRAALDLLDDGTAAKED